MTQYDDGLVHDHGWARAAEAADPACHARRYGGGQMIVTDHPMNDFFDDGLVHDHSWATQAA